MCYSGFRSGTSKIAGAICLIFFAFFAAKLSAQSSPFRPGEPSDTRFIIDQGPDLDTPCEFRDYGTLDFEIEVTRYLGPVTYSGYLIHSNDLINNGIVSRYAWLIMPVYDVDNDCPPNPQCKCERDKVYFNGRYIGDLHGINHAWVLNAFRLNISQVKFAHLESEPSGKNQIRIEIDTENPKELCWCTAVDWALLAFDAAPPVMLVHGWNSNPRTWNRIWTGYLTDRDFLVNPITVEPYDIIENNSRLIAPEVDWMKNEYGVDKINVVAHSKGGLDSRYYLKDNNDAAKNLIMIAPPNGGSKVADLVYDGLRFFFRYDNYNFLDLVYSLLEHREGLQLTSEGMRRFNPRCGPNLTTRYIAKAGCWAIWPGYYWFNWGPNDVFVLKSSAECLGYTTNEPFYSYYFNFSAIHWWQTKYNTEVRDDIISRYLRIQSRTFSQSMGASVQEINDYIIESSEPETYQFQNAEGVMDTITEGNVKTYESFIDQADGAEFDFYWDKGELNLVLINPLGTRIDSAYAVLGDTIKYYRESSSLDVGETAVEYLKRLSPSWRLYAAIEGGEGGAPDEWSLISGVQWRISDLVTFKFDNSIGITSKATDCAPQVGLLFTPRLR